MWCRVHELCGVGCVVCGELCGVGGVIISGMAWSGMARWPFLIIILLLDIQLGNDNIYNMQQAFINEILSTLLVKK